MAERIGYFAQLQESPHTVKVGQTANVFQRLRALQHGTPHQIKLVAVLLNGPLVESEVAKKFAAHRLKGEWYAPIQGMQNYLDEAFRAERVLSQKETDGAFVEAYIAPLCREYLQGRQPNNNELGDLVSRVLSGLLPDCGERAEDLEKATQGKISWHLAKGFIAATERPILIVPATTTVAA